jgi:hypothetical protein
VNSVLSVVQKTPLIVPRPTFWAPNMFASPAECTL